MIRPDFCIIGATKSATSWLHLCLSKHPELEMVSNETYFFSKHFDKGIRHLRGYSAAYTGQKLFGDYSNDYLGYSAQSISNMQQLNPEMKVIACLRNPVDRAYSYYRMEYRANRMGEDMTREIVPGRRIYDEGFYRKHLQAYIEAFGEDRVHVILFDDIKQTPQRVTRDVYRFLGVDDTYVPDILEEAYNNAPTFRPRSVKLHRFFSRSMDKFAHTGKLGRMVKETLRRSPLKKYYHRVNKGREVPTMSDDYRNELKAVYADDVRALGEYLDRDLITQWKFDHL